MSNNTEKNVDTSNLQTAYTDYRVDILANSEKTRSPSKLWKYNGEKDNELDEDYGAYLNNHSSRENDDKKDKDYKDESERKDSDRREYSDKYDSRDRGGFTDKESEYKRDEKSKEEIMLEKLDMLRKLCELANQGVKLSQNYNMNSDYNMMKYEYELHKKIRDKQNNVSWMSNMFLNCVWGLEMLNDNYNPFDVKLKGWSQSVNSEISQYSDVFGDLYEKYHKPGSKGMAPELRLLMLLSGSALKFHLNNKMFGGPTLNAKMEDDPILMEQLRQKALKQKQEELKQKEIIQGKIAKEHETAAQRANDLNMIKQKELEHLKLEKENARKEQEIEELRRQLTMNNTVNNASNRVFNNSNNQQSQSQPTMMASPLVQRFLPQNTKAPEPVVDSFNQSNQLMLEAQKMSMLRQQMQEQQLSELHKIQEIREQQERLLQETKPVAEKKRVVRKKKEVSESSESSSSVSSSSSKISFNPKIDEIIKSSKKVFDTSSESSSDKRVSEKVTELENVNVDEISNSISLGNRSNKSKKTTISTGKGLKQKKTGISIE